jgi:hypothetical protein
MKTKKKNTLALKIIGFLVLGLLFGYTVGTVINSGERSTTITQVLEDNCNCKEVNQVIYAKGIQYGKEGLTTEKAEYLLVDCDTDLSENGIEKLNQQLKKEVKNFEELDLLELEFTSENKSKTIIIKNGIVTTKH